LKIFYYDSQKFIKNFFARNHRSAENQFQRLVSEFEVQVLDESLLMKVDDFVM
jgi:hypothetical protein